MYAALYCTAQVMEKLPEVEAAMIEFFTTRTEEATVGLAILPGVRELLTRLKVRGVLRYTSLAWNPPCMPRQLQVSVPALSVRVCARLHTS